MLRVGDEVVAFGAQHTVGAIEGTTVRLEGVLGGTRLVALPVLLAEPDFALAQGRLLRTRSPYGRADERLVAALEKTIAAETGESTGTRNRLRRRVQAALEAEHGPGVVVMPSKATFNRLVAAMTSGRHTFEQATTRRSLAARPRRRFTPIIALRPGELVQIDTTVLDVRAVLDDGSKIRPELTYAIDVATRTICAAALRPGGTKAVDATLLLARMLVPEPLRPGWQAVLGMRASTLPHEELARVDPRLADAVGRPVIVSETIVPPWNRPCGYARTPRRPATPGPLPLPAHRRHDRQPVPPHPRRRHARHPRRR